MESKSIRIKNDKGYIAIEYKENGEATITCYAKGHTYIILELTKTDKGYKKENMIVIKEDE